jgi:hypothetical protein
MLQEMQATARQQEMQSEARQARLVAQLRTPGSRRPPNRRQFRFAALTAAWSLLSGGLVLGWSASLKGACLGR